LRSLQDDVSKETLATLKSCSRGFLVDNNEGATNASGIRDGRILGLEALVQKVRAETPMPSDQYRELQKVMEASLELWDAIEPRITLLKDKGVTLEDSLASNFSNYDPSLEDSRAACTSSDLPDVIPSAASLRRLSYVPVPTALSAQLNRATFREWKESDRSALLHEVSAYADYLSSLNDNNSLGRLIRYHEKRSRGEDASGGSVCQTVARDGPA
jgi:hypothetical protein